MAIRRGVTVDGVSAGPPRYDNLSREYLYEVARIVFLPKRDDPALDCHAGIRASTASAEKAAEAPGKITCGFPRAWISWRDMEKVVVKAGVPPELIGDMVIMPKGRWDSKSQEYVYDAREIEVRAYRGSRFASQCHERWREPREV